MDKFLLKVYSKDTKRKSLGHSLSIFSNFFPIKFLSNRRALAAMLHRF